MLFKTLSTMTAPPYEPVSDDDLYRHSSQFRIWSLTPEELEKKRRTIYDAACSTVPKKIATEKNLPESSVEVLSFEDEQQLVQYYSAKLLMLGDVLQLSTQVKATALSYFRKFYIVHSTMEYHPKDIFLTCIFLAAKVENSLISIDRLSSMLKKTQAAILDCEFLVLQSLSFTLFVHNGYRPMRGFLLDLQAVVPTIEHSTIESLHNSTKDAIVKSFFSDVQFHYSPPQIALAALMMANEELTMQYLQSKFGTEGLDALHRESIDNKGVDSLATLLQIVNECQQMIESVPVVPDNVGKAIDKKLYYMYNPDKYLQAKRKRARAEQNAETDPAPESNGAGATPDSPSAKRPKLTPS